MRTIVVFCLVVLVLVHFGYAYVNGDDPRPRIKRGYRRDHNPGRYGYSGGYEDEDSDERDVSISGDISCTDEEDRSDSREFRFRDGRRYPADRIRGSRSFSKASASASASAKAFHKRFFS